MTRNKALHAIIIGTCVFASSMTGVFADTAKDIPVSIQMEQVSVSGPLADKQGEIDKYVFQQHAKDFADKGITVTNTGVVGDAVEVGILPYNQSNADYIYGIFGKDMVKVVEGVEASTLAAYSSPQDGTMQITAEQAEVTDAQVISAPVEKESSTVASFFSNIWNWFKNIF